MTDYQIYAWQLPSLRAAMKALERLELDPVSGMPSRHASADDDDDFEPPAH